MKNLKLILLVCIAFATIGLSSCSKHHSSDNEQTWQNLFEDDFSNNNDTNWYIGTEGDSLMANIQNGYYNMTNKISSLELFDAPNEIFKNTTGDIAIEASVKVATTTNSNTQYGGLSFDYNGANSSFFVFGIYTDGSFDVWGYPDGETYTEYKSKTNSNIIHANDFNTLRVELRGNTFHFLINGTEVYNMNIVNDNNLDVAGFETDSQSSLQADYFKAQELQ